nr:hypothetical protein [Candidatus Baldrarchaeota archaeon]
MESKSEEEKVTEILTTEYLLEQVRELQLQVESLKSEIKKIRPVPSGKIGLAFVILGVLSLIFSILKESQILAFIGLGLTFWGALFLFIKPVRYVRSELLHSASLSSYLTLDRIIKDLKFKGKSYYIPPYPKDVYLPEYLRGLKEMKVFISADKGSSIPSIEEMAKNKFLLKNPKGICVAPPGLGLLTQIERELRKDLTKLDLNSLCENLPKVLTEDLQVAKEMEIKTEENGVYIKISDSTYSDLYSKERNLKSVHLLGCPLISAIICATAKATGKIVTIDKDNFSPDNKTVEVWCRFIGG